MSAGSPPLVASAWRPNCRTVSSSRKRSVVGLRRPPAPATGRRDVREGRALPRGRADRRCTPPRPHRGSRGIRRCSAGAGAAARRGAGGRGSRRSRPRWSGDVAGCRATPPVSRPIAFSRPSRICWGVSTLQRAAASSIGNGMPSSRVQIAAIRSSLVGEIRKFWRTRRARSTKSSTASSRQGQRWDRPHELTRQRSTMPGWWRRDARSGTRRRSRTRDLPPRGSCARSCRE